MIKDALYVLQVIVLEVAYKEDFVLHVIKIVCNAKFSMAVATVT